MPANDDFQGVSNCYMYKSRLQEYAQKVGLPTPVYETIKEGPSHQPSFRSTVIVNDVRYDSLPGFFNRKAAEQSAAEVALLDLAKSSEVNQSIVQPIHETGLCKNLLQDYAQKMNYAMPLYHSKKDETPGRLPLFSCTVEIGGIRYIGAAARTKKEAEIKAARTALLAIQSSASHSYEKQFGHSQLTVIPCKERGTELVANAEKTAKFPKPKKPRFKRKTTKKKFSEDKNKKDHTHVQNMCHVEGNINNEVESLANLNDEFCFQEMKFNAVAVNFKNGRSADYPNEKGTLVEEGSLALNSHEVFEDGKKTEMHSKENNHGAVDIGLSLSSGDTPDMDMNVNRQQLVSMTNDSISSELEALEYPMIALEEKIQAGAKVN